MAVSLRSGRREGLLLVPTGRPLGCVPLRGNVLPEVPVQVRQGVGSSTRVGACRSRTDTGPPTLTLRSSNVLISLVKRCGGSHRTPQN